MKRNLDLANQFYVKSITVHIESSSPIHPKKMHEKFNFSPRSSSFFLFKSHGHAQLGQNLTEVAFASSSTYLPMFSRNLI